MQPPLPISRSFDGPLGGIVLGSTRRTSTAFCATGAVGGRVLRRAKRRGCPCKSVANVSDIVGDAQPRTPPPPPPLPASARAARSLENRQRRRLEDQEADIKKLRAEVSSQKTEHDRLVSENGRLSDVVGQLQSQLRTVSAQSSRGHGGGRGRTESVPASEAYAQPRRAWGREPLASPSAPGAARHRPRAENPWPSDLFCSSWMALVLECLHGEVESRWTAS